MSSIEKIGSKGVENISAKEELRQTAIYESIAHRNTASTMLKGELRVLGIDESIIMNVVSPSGFIADKLAIFKKLPDSIKSIDLVRCDYFSKDYKDSDEDAISEQVRMALTSAGIKLAEKEELHEVRVHRGIIDSKGVVTGAIISIKIYTRTDRGLTVGRREKIFVDPGKITFSDNPSVPGGSIKDKKLTFNRRFKAEMRQDKWIIKEEFLIDLLRGYAIDFKEDRLSTVYFAFESGSEPSLKGDSVPNKVAQQAILGYDRDSD